MKRIYSILFAWIVALSAWAQSGEGYDPENPADPTMYYFLTMEAAPRTGGNVGRSRVAAAVGQTVYCEATAKVGYTFKHWMIGDSLVSTERYFSYTMPAHDVAMVAYFEYTGYNPENPGDPFIDGYKHNVTLYATPSVGGYFNSASFMLTENEEESVYAYPRNGYRFVSWKQNGRIISTDNPLRVKMGTQDLEYTATFVYDPANPDEPGANNFNAATGELIIDKFEAGRLNSAISNAVGGWENYSLVQSVVIVGRMESYDFGFSREMTNCSLIDLSRTTGYTEIPSWSFEGMKALTKIILPSTVKRINNSAFSGCDNLSELVCYATVPPTLDPEAFDASMDFVVRVPSVAMSLYKEAEGWKKLTILPLDEETYQLNVSLPADAVDGRYRNMTLELNNISSGQVLRYIITDRTTYAFANLISGTKYNILVKNASDAVLGAIFDVEIEDEDVSVAFESLLQPQNIVVKVVTPEKENVTSQTTITWFDADGKYLSQGAELKGILEGAKINYRVALSKELALLYVASQVTEYEVQSTGNSIEITLAPFEQITLSGCVKDVTTGSGIYNATVTISQTLNGKHSKSIVAKTDNTGAFSATVNNAACNVVVAAYDYISQIFELNDLSDADALSNIQLKGITGARITTAFTYTPSVLDGETAEAQEGYDDEDNISYTLYNKTVQKAILEFKVQSPYIVLLEEVSEGDVISVTATSRTGAFKKVTVDGVVDANNRVEVTFPIVEWGKLQATYKQSASNNVVGILYNSKGELLDQILYSDSTLIYSSWEDGMYTLVTMEGSDFFNSILNLSELSNAGLIEGTHYVKHDVTIQTGKITSLSINNVPELDDSQFYYTGSNTQFTVNKQSVTVGNYVTLRAKVDFKDKYADKVSNVKLVVDLPESCDFVDNSVMVGAGISSYSVGKNRVIVELANTDDVVRFCVIPNEGGYCSPNAFVQFTIDGKDVLQPIGVAEFEAELMKISVPEITSLTSVVVNGVATADSEVHIYDNGVLVGTTYSLANGQWSSKVELYKPYSKSYHSFYAEITAPDGQKFTTANKLLEFDKNYVSLSKVSMIYGSTVINFDPVERKNSTNTYSYVPGNDDFTFTAEFANTDTSSVKNVEFIVLASDGTIRRLKTEYNGVKKLWVAKSKYSNSNKLPVNVKVDFVVQQRTPIYDEEMDEDFTALLNDLTDGMLSAYDNGECTIIRNTENELYFSVLPMGYKNPEYFHITKENYNNIVTLYSDYTHIKNDSTDYAFVQDFSEEAYSICLWDNLTKEALVLSYTGTKNKVSTDGSQRIVPFIISTAAGVGMAIGEYYLKLPEVEAWYQTLEMEKEMWNRNKNAISNILYAICDDGSYRIKESEILNAHNESIQNQWKSVQEYLTNFKNIIDEERLSLKQKCTLKGILSVGLSAIGGIVSGITSLFSSSATVTMQFAGRNVGLYTESFIAEATTAATEGVGQAISSAHGVYLDNESPKTNISEWYRLHSRRIVDEYVQLIEIIKSDYSSCEKEEDEEDEEFPTPPLMPSIDPAGYVYEGVSSNRIEGVTATCYYKETVEDMYGDLKENVVLWNAEEYAQENPLFTDENGMYQWFVPQGLWQVKFEKEGYETTYSDWLPVPPPQLEVNIAMVQNRQPEVKIVHAYEDGIVVEFDKYMQPTTLNTDNIFVVQNGEKVPGTVVMLNEEIAYRDENVTYTSKVRFVYDQPITAEEVTLTVSNQVKSYAGVQMQEAYTQTFDIEKEIKQLVAEETVSVYYGNERTLTVKAQPAEAAAGKTLMVASLSPMILTVDAESVVFDDNGEAVVKVYGELPGTTAVNYSIAGYDCKASTIVKVENEDVKVTANPTASIASGTTIEKGTEVTLYCATEGAVIYYTLDGSCPCDESALQYDGTPIVINEDTELRIMAVAEGRDESDVVVYYYYVKEDVRMTANPTASIASGTTVEKGTEVTLNCTTEGAVIYYTLDGSSPQDKVTQYNGTPIIINNNTELRIMAVAEGCSESDVVVYYYYVEGDVKITANPTASIASGTTVEKGTEVTLSCATEGAIIYYTLDGSSPLDEDTQIRYDGTPIVINEDTELRIMAVAEGYAESYVVTYYYYIAKEEEPALTEVNIFKKWDDVLICDNSAYELVAYQWYKDDMPIEGETNQYYSEEGGLNGSYYVMAKDADGNWGKSNTIICQKRNNSRLKVTPTVVKKNEKCMVTINRSATNGEVVYLNVFNAVGQMIREIRMYDHSIELEFDNSGPYFIKAVELNGNMESEKIIVIE